MEIEILKKVARGNSDLVSEYSDSELMVALDEALVISENYFRIGYINDRWQVQFLDHDERGDTLREALLKQIEYCYENGKFYE